MIKLFEYLKPITTSLASTIQNTKKKRNPPLYEYNVKNNTKYDNKYSGIRGLTPVMRDNIKKFLQDSDSLSNDDDAMDEEGKRGEEDDTKLNWGHIL